MSLDAAIVEFVADLYIQVIPLVSMKKWIQARAIYLTEVDTAWTMMHVCEISSVKQDFKLF